MDLKSLPKHFKKDREIVLAAVRNDGFALADAHSKFLDDKEIAIEAIKNNTHAFLLLNKILTEDRDILALVGLDNQDIEEKDINKDFKKNLREGEK